MLISRYNLEFEKGFEEGGWWPVENIYTRDRCQVTIGSGKEGDTDQRLN